MTFEGIAGIATLVQDGTVTLCSMAWAHPFISRGSIGRWRKPVPRDPQAEHFFDKVPALKGRLVNAHGLTGDIAILKSAVTHKYVRDRQILGRAGVVD
jgi:hypothetical protein